jgi:CHAT domain-containing protein
VQLKKELVVDITPEIRKNDNQKTAMKRVTKLLNKCRKFFIKFSNIYQRIYQKQSLLLAVLLLIFSAFTPVVTKVALPTTVAQTQPDGQVLSYKAMALYRRGEFSNAAIMWQQAAGIFAEQGDVLNQAMVLSNLALSYQKLGEWEQANKAINDSLKNIRSQAENRKELKILELFAQALEIHGYLQRETGQFDESLKSWQEATKIYTQIDAPEKLAQSKINQAETMQNLGFSPRACKILLEVLDKIQVEDCQQLSALTADNLQKKLELYKNESPAMTTILALRSLGETLRYIGHTKQSKLVLETSIYLARKLNNPEEIAANYLSLANTIQASAEAEIVRRIREEYQQEALRLYQQVIDISPSLITQHQAKLNRLSLLLKRQDFEQAEKLWKQIKPQMGSLLPSHTNIYLQLSFAQSLVKLAQKDNFITKENSQIPTFQEIERILTQATTQAKQLGDKSVEAYAVGYRGALYELAGKTQNISQAEKLTKQALSIASTFDNSDIAYQFFWQLGRIYQRQGDTENAISAYTKAYNALQSLRGDLVVINPEVQYSFRDSIEPVYRELVKLHLDYADSLTKSGKEPEKIQKLLSQARDVIESLQLAEINNFFQEACVEAKPKKIDNIDKKAAVIYTIILPEKLGVILSLPNQPLKLHMNNKITKEQLEKTVEDVRSSLLDPQSDALSLYKDLYSWLIQPFEKELTANQEIKNLAFILDGELQNIPMSVLLDEHNKYLIEKYAVALTPGLQLVEPKPITAIKNLTVLTAGLSELQKDFPAHEGFEQLPNVKIELEKIQNLGLSSQLILNQNFVTQTIIKEINKARLPIVHLATHGKFSSNFENTFILVWDNRINVKELKNLLQNHQFNQRLPIELLVLSACETASGDKRAALGLAGVAVRAGARSTLATLWSVADASTAKLMGEFYQQLKDSKKNNINKVQALQVAQVSLIKNQEYKHPYFWAPFVIVGNWQ